MRAHWRFVRPILSLKSKRPVTFGGFFAITHEFAKTLAPGLSRAGLLGLFGSRGSDDPRAATRAAAAAAVGHRFETVAAESQESPAVRLHPCIITKQELRKLKSMSELSFRPARVPTNDSKNSV